MSQSELAQIRNLSRCTLHRHIAALENLGYLTIHRRPGQVSSYQLTAGGQGFSRITRRLRRLLPETGELKGTSAPPRLRSEKTVGRQDILATLQENAGTPCWSVPWASTKATSSATSPPSLSSEAKEQV